MAISVNIEKKLHGFSLKVKFGGRWSAIGILGASGSGKEYDSALYCRNRDTGLRKNCYK